MARKRGSIRARSRRKRAALIGIGLIGAAFLIWLDRSVVSPARVASLAPPERATAADLARYHGRTLSVARIVDGDTLYLDVPDARSDVTKVRLLGIDTPEMDWGGNERMYFADEATACAARLALGKRVRVHLDEGAGSRDRYGRLLAYVELPDGRFLNEELLLQGCAYADLRFEHGYYHKYRQLEASARALKAGLWAGVTPERMPQWRQRMETEPSKAITRGSTGYTP